MRVQITLEHREIRLALARYLESERHVPMTEEEILDKLRVNLVSSMPMEINAQIDVETDGSFTTGPYR